MKSASKRFGLFIVIAAQWVAISCEQKHARPAFSSYYEQNKTGAFNAELLRTKELVSKPFQIDTLYRSMKGPIDEQVFFLADSGEVVWLTGYSVEVIDNNDQPIEMGFMCHNNLNLASERNFPWKPQNFDYQNRVFTLTQGVTNISLPQGYAIPIPGEQGLKVMFQALNHNYERIDTVVRHRITLEYFIDSEIDFELKPVYMQTLWLVKQYAGPIGKMGEQPEENAPRIESANEDSYHPAQQPTCGVDMLANNANMNGVDMYFDNYGRKYTGHWKIPPGEEELSMDVTQMLNLDKNRSVVMAVAHVHPFCKSLSLIDEKEKMVELSMTGATRGIGLKNIEVLQPTTPIILSKDKTYELTSKYHNTSEDTLSAMSVMYLYLLE